LVHQLPILDVDLSGVDQFGKNALGFPVIAAPEAAENEGVEGDRLVGQPDGVNDAQVGRLQLQREVGGALVPVRDLEFVEFSHAATPSL